MCLDNDENGLFRLEHDLRERLPHLEVVPFLGDVRDRRRMSELLASYRPEIVFHAAAYKHVPMLQYHPLEAIRNNVGGTDLLVELADREGVEAFVLISTDKAVNPTSVMGATKRIAERIIRARNRAATTRFCAIRFGNVLGSNGSVVELFLKQIREGRPVTVTHPRIERYFMTIPEAVHLVLFAGGHGAGRRDLHPGHGRAGEDRPARAPDDRLRGLTPGRRRADRLHRPAARGEAVRGTLDDATSSPGRPTTPASWSRPAWTSGPTSCNAEVGRLLGRGRAGRPGRLLGAPAGPGADFPGGDQRPRRPIRRPSTPKPRPEIPVAAPGRSSIFRQPRKARARPSPSDVLLQIAAGRPIPSPTGRENHNSAGSAGGRPAAIVTS